MFSSLCSRFQAPTNRLYRLRAELEDRGEKILDLVSGNVHDHGIRFPQSLLEDILTQSSRRTQVYRPDPLGQLEAREAVASYYRSQGVRLPPENVLLTPGTSVSYMYCFKLLADAGEEILCPSPSYPLFEYIAALSGVRLVSYKLRESEGWSIDMDNLEGSVSTKSRAVVLISPHNPTGHVASPEEVRSLAQIAARHGLAIVADEVFQEFLIQDRLFARPALTEAPLVFTLNGFSKMLALPGLKLGWLGVSGEESHVRRALQALELISDTFLPVNECVQSAVPELFHQGRVFLQSYKREIRDRWTIARKLLAGSRRIEMEEPQGGFYVTLRLKDLEEEAAAEAILRGTNILLHPGHYYDMSSEHLVMSFIHKPEILEQAIPAFLGTMDSL